MGEDAKVEIARLQEQIKGMRDQQNTNAETTEKLFNKLFARMESLEAAMNRGRGIFAAALTFAGAAGAAATCLIEWMTWRK